MKKFLTSAIVAGAALAIGATGGFSAIRPKFLQG